jgi:hypothetical protein
MLSPSTRQNFVVGKGGRRDGGHLPLAFAECPPLGTRQRVFIFVFTAKGFYFCF